MLTTEQILNSAEDVLRRYGPKKTTVVDIARDLNVSHGTVYRHFKSKSDLHAAITKRWLERVTAPLADIANSELVPAVRLRKWFETLMDIKVKKAIDDPEMFASYSILAQGLPEQVVYEHLEVLIEQIEHILVEGKQSEVFAVDDCAQMAQTLFFATTRYHHPLHVKEWGSATIKEEFNHLFALIEKAIHKQ